MLLGEVAEGTECINTSDTILVSECVTLPTQSTLHHLSSLTGKVLLRNISAS